MGNVNGFSEYVIEYADDEFHGKSFNADAPRGTRWSTGGYLLRITDGMDYHPLGQDIVGGRRHFAAAVQREMNKNKELRKAAKLTEREFKKALAKAKRTARKAKKVLFVYRDDSSSAGNCEAGTLAFMRRHGIVGDKIEVQALLALPTTPADAVLVRATILAAMKRVNSAELADSKNDTGSNELA